jgi:class 3 adenylate cyclase
MSVYFEQVSRAISDEHGTVDKFIGDGIMAFWGAPIVLEDHALRACAGALRAARRMEDLNADWHRQGKPSFRLRIGLNSASVLVGNVASTERFSYTVMGDGVNVASRMICHVPGMRSTATERTSSNRNEPMNAAAIEPAPARMVTKTKPPEVVQ